MWGASVRPVCWLAGKGRFENSFKTKIVLILAAKWSGRYKNSFKRMKTGFEISFKRYKRILMRIKLVLNV